MAKKRTGRMAESVSALLARITEWRQNREKRTAMPAELWEEATRLGREFGAYPVARDLNLQYARLKRRIKGLPPSRSRKPSVEDKGFMELRAVSVQDSVSRPAIAPSVFVTEVEMTKPGGVTFRVRQTGPEGMDVVGLAASCFGKE